MAGWNELPPLLLKLTILPKEAPPSVDILILLLRLYGFNHSINFFIQTKYLIKYSFVMILKYLYGFQNFIVTFFDSVYAAESFFLFHSSIFLYFIDPPSYESTYDSSITILRYVLDAFVISTHPRVISGYSPNRQEQVIPFYYSDFDVVLYFVYHKGILTYQYEINNLRLWHL